MTKLALKALTIFGLLLSGASCVPDSNSYSQFYTIDDDGWCYDDSLVFTPTVADSIVQGRLMIAVRHDSRYRYSNLWLELSHPEADTVIRDTINIDLADVYGRWLGTASAVSYTKTDTITKNIKILRDKNYVIRHVMRPDTIKDIERIGLIFEPTKIQ
jgi:gliding motility-associated lipoprotein GldH